MIEANAIVRPELCKCICVVANCGRKRRNFPTPATHPTNPIGTESEWDADVTRSTVQQFFAQFMSAFDLLGLELGAHPNFDTAGAVARVVPPQINSLSSPKIIGRKSIPA